MQFRKTVVIMAVTFILCVSLHGFSESEFLKAVPDMVDFGIVEEGEPADAVVTVQNTGTAPIEITGVRTN